MPIYRLIDKLIFPPSALAEPDGLLAVGGDLSPNRLLEAYRQGIFPWYSPGDPILWWSPQPRLVLEPASIHVSKSLRKEIARNKFQIKLDTAFSQVLRECAMIPRRESEGTWITPEMQEAYIRLHKLGFAHSVECWQDEDLVGGLYGLSLGKCFFGESMFAKKSNASKIALVALANILEEWGFQLIDCQVTTQHLIRLGACEIDRADFLLRLRAALCFPDRVGPWTAAVWTKKL